MSQPCYHYCSSTGDRLLTLWSANNPSYFNSLNHLSYTTHNRHQTIIQSLLNFALEQGYLSSNPIARLKRRKPGQEKGEHGSDEVIRYLTQRQLKTLYNLLEPNSLAAYSSTIATSNWNQNW